MSDPVRNRLEALRREVAKLSEQTAEARRPVALDQQAVGRLTRMDAIQTQAMQLETERRRQLDITRIDAALARIADDSYGDCVTCGEPIAEARLRHDPAVATCIDCARARE